MVLSIIMPASTANRFDSCSLIKTLKPITKSEIEIDLYLCHFQMAPIDKPAKSWYFFTVTQKKR